LDRRGRAQPRRRCALPRLALPRRGPGGPLPRGRRGLPDGRAHPERGARRVGRGRHGREGLPRRQRRRAGPREGAEERDAARAAGAHRRRHARFSARVPRGGGGGRGRRRRAVRQVCPAGRPARGRRRSRARVPRGGREGQGGRVSVPPRDAARRLDVLAVGEPLYELAEAAVEGRPVYLPGFGGDVSNVAVAVARQGGRAAIHTRLGDDAFGRRFLELWRAEGVDASTVEVDASAHTGVYFIGYGPAGHEFSYLREGSAASLMRPEGLPLGAIAASRVLHVSAISQAISPSACDAVFTAVEAARERGTAVSYDTNLRLSLWPLARARAVILATVGMADYCLPSLDDAAAL